MTKDKRAGGATTRAQNKGKTRTQNQGKGRGSAKASSPGTAKEIAQLKRELALQTAKVAKLMANQQAGAGQSSDEEVEIDDGQ